jgi:hypothetical protein
MQVRVGTSIAALVPTLAAPKQLQRILALTTAIWHNDHTGQPVMRSLLA